MIISISPMDGAGATIFQVFLCNKSLGRFAGGFSAFRSERECGTCSTKFLTHVQTHCFKCRKAYNQRKSSQNPKPNSEAAKPSPLEQPNGEAAKTSEGLRPVYEAGPPAGTGGGKERLDDDTKPRHDTHVTLPSTLSDNSSAGGESPTKPSAFKARQGDSGEVRPVATALQQRPGDHGPKLEHEHTHTRGGARQNEKVTVPSHATGGSLPLDTRTGSLLAQGGVKCNPATGQNRKDKRHIGEAERLRRGQQSAADKSSSVAAKEEEERRILLDIVREAREARLQSERAKLAHREGEAAARAAVKAKEADEARDLDAIRDAIETAVKERAEMQIANGQERACPSAPIKAKGVAWRERGDDGGGLFEVNHVTLDSLEAVEMAKKRGRELNARKEREHAERKQPRINRYIDNMKEARYHDLLKVLWRAMLKWKAGQRSRVPVAARRRREAGVRKVKEQHREAMAREAADTGDDQNGGAVDWLQAEEENRVQRILAEGEKEDRYNRALVKLRTTHSSLEARVALEAALRSKVDSRTEAGLRESSWYGSTEPWLAPWMWVC